MTLTASTPLPRWGWRLGQAEEGVRETAEETPIAISHDGSTAAVMMATPTDLEDFAVGFSLTEGAIASLSEIRAMDVVEQPSGVEVRLWLTSRRSAELAARRRRLVGPTGCGLCGLESLSEAVKAPPTVSTDVRVSAEQIVRAMGALAAQQPLGAATRAVHAAALWAEGNIVLAREDVGRHNALDKLVGAAVRAGEPRRQLLLLTSRISVELVQKAAVLGTPVICAVSAPTALAVRLADEAGITLVGIVREDGLEVFTHPRRVSFAQG
ncbi:formate dehydrogenase accessory sulfurtransferase FdhD [Phenylobacterium sp. J426]|uniref:formate dehydrogenase accessory sulfurtransferase FdhD n=1 Tax=Phenylobacterium sp. J426 TaxID=2898439 RepID=UPI002150C4A3|nr:formate dehydrogenase accessory sulfurtransferase FdhD [Phenylobacterium sp. J426]MCR5872804.1 formate dehydrogenase accessory sulfurtransferase FdhD [Phenylobacterium sp. J426]